MSRNSDSPIPFALPSIGKDEEEAVLKVLRSGWLTTGKEARAFEMEFAERVGSSYALAVNSATAGLHLALEAFGVKSGDAVITSPYTFTATAEVVRYLGAHPVFVDIEDASYNIDPELVDRALKHTGAKGVIPVHIGGLPCDMHAICEAASHTEAFVIEDAAHAFPVGTPEGMVGTLGDAGVYSFYATKTITTGEGGMIVTDRPDIAKRISVMRLHGIDRDIWERYVSVKASWEYRVVEAGYKYNLPDIQAALGRVQLRRAEELYEKRKRIAALYIAAFKEHDFLFLPPSLEKEQSWHLFILRVNEKKLSIGRDEFVEKLQEQGIGTSVHYIPLHIMPYYSTMYGYKPHDFPRALAKFHTSFSIPIYPDLTEEQIERIIQTVLNIGKRYYKA